MSKPVLTTYVVAIALSIGMVGCSSNNSLTSKIKSPFSKWGKSKNDSDIALSGQVDYNKPYDEYASEYSSRPIVSPALGLEGAEKPNAFKRMAGSVASTTKRMGSSVSNGFKKGAKKAGDIVAPRDTEMVDSISVNSPAGKPDASFFVSIARVQEVAGNIEGAESSYKQALEADDKDLEALLSYAHLMDRQGRLAEATNLYQQATKNHPQSATAHNDLSICYARQGMMEPSVDALTTAVRLEPQRKLYRNNIAKVLLKMNRIDEAYEHLAFVHGPGVAHYNVAYLLQEMDNTEEAIRHFEYAAAADPTLVEAKRWQQMLTQQQNPFSTVAADQRYNMMPPAGASQGAAAQQTAPQPQQPAPGTGSYRGPLVPPQPGADANTLPVYGNSLY